MWGKFALLSMSMSMKPWDLWDLMDLGHLEPIFEWNSTLIGGHWKEAVIRSAWDFFVAAAKIWTCFSAAH